MFDLIYTKVLVVHILSVMVAVGTVTVTDYLHILGVRDPVLEKRALFVFPHLSNLIRLALLAVYITGAIMVFAKPEILGRPLFWVKLSLVVIVTVNGYVLHHYFFPRIEHGIRNDKHKPRLMRQAAFAGSLSVVSWYGIVILALTKDLGYGPVLFVICYLLALGFAYGVALHVESRKMGLTLPKL